MNYFTYLILNILNLVNLIHLFLLISFNAMFLTFFIYILLLYFIIVYHEQIYIFIFNLNRSWILIYHAFYFLTNILHILYHLHNKILHILFLYFNFKYFIPFLKPFYHSPSYLFFRNFPSPLVSYQVCIPIPF